MRLAYKSILCLFGTTIALCSQAEETPPEKSSIRVATYNVSFYRHREGQLQEDLEGGKDRRAKAIAEVIKRVQPDILLLNEFDYVKGGTGPTQQFYCRYLAIPSNGLEPSELKHRFTRAVNTGMPSGLDLDGDGKTNGPGDAYGFGRYPGQYGMAVYSKFPIDILDSRTFRKFLWKDMPDAKLPVDLKTGESYYSDEVLEVFRLSSKSHWDVPIEVKIGERTRTLHLLCSHPTPPVFDGPEDRNGRRNHDEIRLWADYVSPERSGYLVDDRGTKGGLAAGESFVIVGDLNADPTDGDSGGENIRQLLKHPRVNSDVAPTSEGAAEAAKMHPDLNAKQTGDPTHDTADFSGDGHGNLRVDYVLPSRDFRVVDSGVFWPQRGEPGSEAIRATDHRLVWIDLALPAKSNEPRRSKTQ